MKKLFYMFILVLILIVACIPLIYGFGVSYLIEAEIEKQLVANPQLKLVSKDFSKGYFKTKYNVQYSYTYNSNKSNKPVNLKIDIKGGWANTPDLMSFMDFVNNDFNPDSIILFKNEPETKVTIPGKTAKDKLEFLIYGSFKISSKLGVILSFNLPKFFKEKDAKLFSLENMKLEVKTRWNFSKLEKIHEGQMGYESGSFSIESIDFTTANNKSDLRNFLIETKNIEKDGKISSHLNMTLKSLNVFNKKIRNVVLNVFFEHLKTSGLVKLNKWFINNKDQFAKANLEIKEKKTKLLEHPVYAPLKKIADDIFPKKISTGIKSFKGKIDGEKFDLKLITTFDYDSFDAFIAQMASLSFKTNLKINSSIPLLNSGLTPVIAQKMYASAAKVNPSISKEQLGQMVKVQVESIIESLIKNNIIVKKDLNIKSDITFEKGQLNINGNSSNPAILMSLFMPKGAPAMTTAQGNSAQSPVKPVEHQNVPNQDPKGQWMNNHKVFVGEWKLSFSDQVTVNIFEHENKVYVDCMGAKNLIKQNAGEFEINCGQKKQVVIPLNQGVFKLKGTEKLIYRKP